MRKKLHFEISDIYKLFASPFVLDRFQKLTGIQSMHFHTHTNKLMKLVKS